MKKTILVMLTIFVIPVVVNGQSVGVGFYEDLEELPRLYENVQSYYLSSYDRTGGNDDGFRGTYSQLYIEENGEQKPRFHGTGHEDEYQGGWSTFWLTNPYSLPLFGEPKTENLIDVFGQVNGSTTAYRFWSGKIPFRSSVRISTEHGNHNDTPVNYSSLVYYYYVP